MSEKPVEQTESGGDFLLDVRNLHTSFFTPDGEVKAVRGVNFHVASGETIGIVGESGSGKSVTSLSLLGLLPSAGRITRGQIFFEGRDLAKASPAQMRAVRGARAAMIFQDPMSSLNPLIPVGRQVEEMILTHQQMNKTQLRRRVLELFDKVRISDAAKRYRSYPHEFSGGMRQRVMIAMALACNPALLIADEPTTALDVTIQDQILRLLVSLQQEFHMSVIFISHDLGVVSQVCRRVMVMYGGMIMEHAGMEDLFEKPRHPYTLGLLDSVPGLHQNRDEPLKPILGSPPDMSNPPSGCPFHPRCPHARNICAEELPPFYQAGPEHYSRCRLLDPGAPAEARIFAPEGGSGGE